MYTVPLYFFPSDKLVAGKYFPLTFASAQHSRRVALRAHPVNIKTHHIASIRISWRGSLLSATMTKDQAAEEAANPKAEKNGEAGCFEYGDDNVGGRLRILFLHA